MKTINFAIALCALVALLVGCQKKYVEPCCLADNAIMFDYLDEQGGEILTQPQVQIMIDMVDDQPVAPHKHLGKMIYLTENANGTPYYIYGEAFSPACCDRMFTKVRSYVKTNILDKYENIIGYVADTVDVELKYLSTKESYIETVSLNGVPQWRRDTCKLQNESFYTRIVRRVVSDKEIVRN